MLTLQKQEVFFKSFKKNLLKHFSAKNNKNSSLKLSVFLASQKVSCKITLKASHPRSWRVNSLYFNLVPVVENSVVCLETPSLKQTRIFASCVSIKVIV